MKKEDLTIIDLLMEAVGVVAGLIYIGLQIYYGIAYGAGAVQIIMNILILGLVFTGLTILSIYPEKVNGLTKEVCQGKIRQYTIHMVRLIKLVFMLSLLFTSICDAMGYRVDSAYSLLVMGLIVVIAIVYEVRIIRIIRKNSKKDK